MDDFRKHQRAQCGDASSLHHGCYGCPCCNRGDLNSRKKTNRRIAKVRFRRETAREIDRQR